MQPVNRAIVDKFAKHFAGYRVGFSAKQITDYFMKYSNYVKAYDHYAINPTRSNLFIESVYCLTPKYQYYSLNDLAFIVHESKYEYPSLEIRNKLLEELHCQISPDPIGLRISQLRETAFREDWATANSRIQAEPAAAITSARTMIETVFKTILNERNVVPDNSGDLIKLLKQTEKILSFETAVNQNEHQILQGLTSTIQGIASISNDAGDRHGTIMGKSISDPFIARLVVNAAGVIVLTFIELHLFTKL
jgi:hypothetical protein